MKLFTKELDSKLFANYSKGSDMENQMVVGKIFNPYGRGTWYLMNSDPQDPDYLWGIVDLFEVEMGSFSRSELESVKVPPFNLGLERDMYFTPIKASELFQGLQEGKQYAKGGELDGLKKRIEEVKKDAQHISKHNKTKTFVIDYKYNKNTEKENPLHERITWGEQEDVDYFNEHNANINILAIYDNGVEKLEKGGELDNKEMVANKATEIAHHAKELHETLEHSEDVPAWVVSKIQRSATDIADVAHYLEGEEKEFAKGGELSGKYVKIHYAGVREPEVEKIESIHITPSHYSHREVTIHHKDGSVSKFPLSKLEAFESGEQVEIKGGKEPYAIELVKDVMAKGGETFASKTKAVAKRLQGEKVPSEYQGAYGKKYSPKEAREAAQRIIGAQVAKSKMADGGEIKKHKHIQGLTIELIEPTNKGWKVKQIETIGIGGKKLSKPKETIQYFNKQDIKELFD